MVEADEQDPPRRNDRKIWRGLAPAATHTYLHHAEKMGVLMNAKNLKGTGRLTNEVMVSSDATPTLCGQTSRWARTLGCAAGALALVLGLAGSPFANAQTHVSVVLPGNYGRAIIIPPSHVISARGDRIRAQANYLQGMADLVESNARARYVQDLAAQQAIQNHAQGVKTYFQVRELNREYTRRENPGYLDHAQKGQQSLDRLHRDFPELVLEGNVREETLNRFMRRMGGTLIAEDKRQGLPDVQFQPGETDLIVLTDGARGPRKLTFRAREGLVLQTAWPPALRAPEFEHERDAFETLRQQAVTETTTAGHMSYDTQLQIQRAVNGLKQTLEANYPRERRFESSPTWQEYHGAKKFLDSLASNVRRVVEINDRRAFDGSLRFEGKTVVELLHHMASHGLEFGPPPAGGERVYRKLYEAIRNIWLDTPAA